MFEKFITKNNSFVLLFFLLYQIFEIGIMDSFELFLGNEEVYRIHNFPDILGKNYDSFYHLPIKKYFYAGLSGMIATWPLFVWFLLKLSPLTLAIPCRSPTLYKKSYMFYYSHLCLIILLTVADCIVLSTYDNHQIGYYYIFRNHRHFYVIHMYAEFISLIIVIITIICSI